MPNPQYHEQGRLLRSLARQNNCIIVYSKHAPGQMKLRHVTKVDIINILKAGFVVRAEPDDEDPDYDKLTVSGTSIEGDKIEVVVIPVEMALYIEIITVINKSNNYI